MLNTMVLNFFFFILSSYLQRLKPEAPERLQKHTIVYYRKPYTPGNCHLSLFFHPITKSDPFYLDVSEINSILSTPLPHKGFSLFLMWKKGDMGCKYEGKTLIYYTLECS